MSDKSQDCESRTRRTRGALHVWTGPSVQDSLGGDAKALMFCNLAPQPLHVSETLSSLAFASKVSSVVLKTPTRRVEEARDEEEAAGSGEMATPQLGSRAVGRSSRASMTPNLR